MISPDWAQASGSAEFSEIWLLRSPQNRYLRIVQGIFSSGRRGMTERKIKQKDKQNFTVLQTNYYIKT